MADTILLQPVLSWTSSFVVPMALMARLTQSTHLCFGLLLFLPGGTISSFFRHILGLVSSRVQTTSVALSCPSVILSTFSLSLMLSFLTSQHSIGSTPFARRTMVRNYIRRDVGQPDRVTNKVLEAGVQTSYVHSSINWLLYRESWCTETAQNVNLSNQDLSNK